MEDDRLREALEESARLARPQPGHPLVHALAAGVVLLAAVVLLHLAGRLATVGPLALTAFFTVGKLLILLGTASEKVGMTTGELVLMILFLDVWVGYVFAFQVQHVYRAGRVGAWLRRLTGYCRWWLASNPWMRRWAFTGVMVFVLIPLTGTGAPGGSLLGRLVGLGPWTTLLGISLGSVLGCVLVAGLAEPLRPLVREVMYEWWFEGLGLAVLAIVMLLLWRLGRRLSRAAAELERSAGGGEA